MNLLLAFKAEESNTMEIQRGAIRTKIIKCAAQVIQSKEPCSELTCQALDVHQGTREHPLDCAMQNYCDFSD